MKGFPYVLSFFAISGVRYDPADTNACRGIAALLEPSRIALAECDECVEDEKVELVNRLASSIGRTTPEECAGALNDCDIGSDSSLFVSWAGAVLVDSQTQSDVELQELIALETRVQIAWAMAHYAQMWSRSLLSNEINAGALDETRWRIVPLLRTARSMTDASISTKHSGIMTALIQSSGLDTQISEANQSFESAEEYMRFMERGRTRAYESYVEVALFVLAISQIIPLFFDIPLWKLTKWWSIGAIAPLLLLLILRFRSRSH